VGSEKGHCKIITIAESFFIRAREYKVEGQIKHRYDPEPKKAGAAYYLALGICGHRLALDKQLLIIKELKDKTELLKILQCLHVLKYDILKDFFISKLDNAEYLHNFVKTTNYDIFLKRWVRWQIKSNKLKAYWNICVNIIQGK
jgi:hypothetical protein